MERRDTGHTATCRSVGLRDRVIQIVGDIQLPIPVADVVELGLIRFGCRIPLGKLSSLLEHEETQYDVSPESHYTWLCPAITVLGHFPVYQFVTLSDWAMEDRMIASRTLRTLHLKTLDYLIGLTIRLEDNLPPERDFRLMTLVRRYAGSLPECRHCGGYMDFDAILAGNERELRQVLYLDETERMDAAAGMGAYPEIFRLFGREWRLN